MQRHLGKVGKRPKDHFKMSCQQESDGFQAITTLSETRIVKPPNDACIGHTNTVRPYIAQKCAKKRLECPRMLATIRANNTSLVRGRRNHSRVIFGIFSL